MAVAVAGATTVVLMGLGLVGGTGPFVAMHVAYFGVVLTVPLISVGMLVLARHDLRPTLLGASLLCLVPVPLGLYMTHVEPGWLRIDHVAVPVAAERLGSGTVRVGVVSDMQMATVGEHERRAISMVMAERPDVILVPGDLFHMEPHRFEAQLPALRELYSALRAPHGVYVVPGDVDGIERLQRLVDGTDMELLLDTTTSVEVRDRRLLIGGIGGLHDDPGAASVRDALLSEPADGAITVQLAHRPDAVLELPPDARIDLTVSGHTHGGQIVVPLVGPLLTLSDVPRAVARGGLHDVDGNRVYVSPGVGAERGGAPQVRFLNRPSVTVLDLG